jgi:RNase adapter protein RapZ
MHTHEGESQLLIVTGYSGAGKSTVLRALEDIGFFCVDNLPISLLPSFFQLTSGPNSMSQNIALGIDARGGHFIAELIAQLEQSNTLRQSPAKIFFLTASEAVLVKRFQETRRKHPLATTSNVVDAIVQEKKLLQPLAEFSDVLLDTDQFNIHQLRNLVRELFATTTNPKLIVNLISFGFKYGVPTESNFVFDIRSLPNPYFIPELRHLDGTSEAILTYLFDQPPVQEYWDKVVEFFHFSTQKAFQEGRSFVSFAIGCTGGRHRSVAFVHKLGQQQVPFGQCLIKHRDIGQKE